MAQTLTVVSVFQPCPIYHRLVASLEGHLADPIRVSSLSVPLDSHADAGPGQASETPPEGYVLAADVRERSVGQSRSALAVKRTVDVLIAAIVLVLAAPFVLLIALAIRIASPGPVLFRQTRVGRHGATFSMWKLRTMIDGAESARAELDALNESSGIFKLKSDPRLTGVGRLLRRGSVDEIPQLVNVLRGEMSLVGPRPLVCEEDARIQAPYRARLLMRPGMTGPWQALGPIRPSLREMVVIDCLYVENWCLWTDAKILVRTLWHVVRLHGV